jgi:hypothetical protein
MSANDRISTRQRRALAVLLEGQTMGAAATAAGVSPATLYRWRHEPAFVAELRAGESELIAGALRSLTALARPAVTVAGSVLEDRSAAPGVRLRAAQVVIEALLRLKEAADLEARIVALEAARDEQAQQ